VTGAQADAGWRCSGDGARGTDHRGTPLVSSRPPQSYGSLGDAHALACLAVVAHAQPPHPPPPRPPPPRPPPRAAPATTEGFAGYPFAISGGLGNDYGGGVGIKATFRTDDFGLFGAFGATGDVDGDTVGAISAGARFYFTDAGAPGVFAQAAISPLALYDLRSFPGVGVIYGPSIQGGLELRTLPLFLEAVGGLGFWATPSVLYAELCFSVGIGVNFGGKDGA
jgi:hypothetical protein